MMSVRTTQPESPRKCSSATWSTASDTTTTRYVVESDCAASGAATVRTKARSGNEFTAWVIFFGGAAARLPPLPARFLVRRLDRRPIAPPRGAATGAGAGARRWLSYGTNVSDGLAGPIRITHRPLFMSLTYARPSRTT